MTSPRMPDRFNLGIVSISLSSYLGLSVLAPGFAVAQAPPTRTGLLAEQVGRDTIAAEKAESLLRTALFDAQKLSVVDPGKAILRLRDALAVLEADSALADSKRTALVHMVKDRIRVAEADAKTAADQTVVSAVKKAETEGRRADDLRAAEEHALVNRNLLVIKGLRDAGRTEDAVRMADDLARRYPTAPAVLASRHSASTLDQVATARQFRIDQDRRSAGVLRDVQRSNVPLDGDVEFPKDWAERTKNRKSDQVRLSPKERAIVTALNTPVTSVSFKESKLEDILEYLSTLMGQPIVLDKQALDDLQVGYDSKISVNMRGVAARTVLRRVLSELNLTYVVRDETIQVTSPQRAKDLMVTRTYYLGDIVAGLGTSALWYGPVGTQLIAQQNAQIIVDMIQGSIDPQSWRANGGAGSITFNYPTMSLVIRQSAEVHSLLGSSLLR